MSDHYVEFYFSHDDREIWGPFPSDWIAEDWCDVWTENRSDGRMRELEEVFIFSALDLEEWAATKVDYATWKEDHYIPDSLFWLWTKTYVDEPEWWFNQTVPRCMDCGVHPDDTDNWCNEHMNDHCETVHDEDRPVDAPTE